MDDEPDERLEAAWKLFEAGQAEEALEQLWEGARTPESAALETLCWIELGDLRNARTAFEHAEGAEDSPAFEPSFDHAFAHAALALAEWRIEDAHASFQALAESEPEDAGVCERISLCADLLADEAQADRWLARAHTLDPEAFPAPERLSAEAFLEVVDAAVQQLPDEFRAALDDVNVVIDRVPTLEHVGGAALEELGGTPPDMLGLFVGPTDLEGGFAGELDTGFGLSPGPPPTIFLFQRNLERAATDREMLEREIAITLYHELAHKLGFDEDGVDSMGLA